MTETLLSSGIYHLGLVGESELNMSIKMSGENYERSLYIIMGL